ncbi:MAG: response regulator transcription factor [Eubacterium sp.]|nr:response regulator transcription factor [Eubacterium sp.]
MEKKRIIIIDDDELITMSLKMILQSDTEFEVVAEGHDGSEALPLYEEMKPDIILMDIRMPNMNGLEAAKEVLTKHKEAVILLLTTFSDEEYIVQALKTGVRGYLLKQDYKALPESLRAAVSGQTVFGGAVVERIPDIMQSKNNSFDYSAAGITDKEYAVIQLVAEGLSNQEIADKLFLSLGTVRNYISVILEKLEIRDRTQLAIFYLKH